MAPPVRRPPNAQRLTPAGRTRARLLEAAAKTFAERGYEAATVREVCRRARANGAAVNYHFGSKERLYRETLAAAVRLQQAGADEALAAQPAPADPGAPADAASRLEAAVERFAASMLAPRPEWHRRLLLRELAAPSPALLAVLTEGIRPTFAALQATVRPFLPGADPRALALTAMSIVGQVLYHRVAAPLAARLLGVAGYDATLVAEVSRHVASFTRRALSGPPPGPPPGRTPQAGATPEAP